MLSCRRVQPIPQDFSHAMARAGLAPDDLLPHLKRMVPPKVALPRLPSPPPEETQPPLLGQVDPTLRGEFPTQTVPFPSHFPSLPGQYTYKASSVFTEPVKDPRKIREKAAEEGRLGEESLRRLLADSSKALRNATQAHGRKQSSLTSKGGWWQRAEEERWEQTMQALSRDRSGKGSGRETNGIRGGAGEELGINFGLDGAGDARTYEGGDGALTPDGKGDTGGIVNFERKYHRKGVRAWSGGQRRASMAAEDVTMTGAN